MKLYRLLLVLLGIVLLLPAQPPAGQSTIVVFSDNVRFDDFLPFYRADARMNADPPAWGYLNRAVVGAVQFLEAGAGFRADHVYSAALRGFAAQLTPAQVTALRSSPLIKYVESDGAMTTIGKPAPQPIMETVPWGIAKIGDTGYYNVNVSGVNVYVIDTGIDRTHPDLNVANHVNFAGGQNTDCNGHGTHVAGTIAAKHNTQDVVGVAPGVPLYGVKVLGCNGSGWTSGVIKGVDWVTTNHSGPSVANMSLGGSASTALDDAVIASAQSGVVYALAAGNEGDNACNHSPARAGKGNNGIITTGAVDSGDLAPYWSNWGSCVDLWAPGVSILSTKKGGGTTTMSGTSMASPHVAGAAARYLISKPSATPTSVEQGLAQSAVSAGPGPRVRVVE